MRQKGVLRRKVLIPGEILARFGQENCPGKHHVRRHECRRVTRADRKISYLLCKMRRVRLLRWINR